MSGIKVSIITPCLNSEKTIRQTIESVLKQTYSNIEYIIVDGGSSDGTLDIIREYESLFHGRLRYISEPDCGIYNAMNKGIRLSKGEIIGIINSDDFYENDTVEQVLKYWNGSHNQVIYGYMRLLKNGRCMAISRDSHINLDENMITHPTCFVARKIYCKYGLFLENFKIAADYEFVLRLYKKYNVEFVRIPRVLANFRVGGISSTDREKVEKKNVQLRYGCINFWEYILFWVERWSLYFVK